uniref:Uncharacterized protein n=1 Tax=Cacopsylla melanoneura TaxID=428564 RepID=A0A8D8Z428_9HEMI
MYLLVCICILVGSLTPICYGQFFVDDEDADEVMECLKKGLNAKTLRRIEGGRYLMMKMRMKWNFDEIAQICTRVRIMAKSVYYKKIEEKEEKKTQPFTFI